MSGANAVREVAPAQSKVLSVEPPAGMCTTRNVGMACAECIALVYRGGG